MDISRTRTCLYAVDYVSSGNEKDLMKMVLHPRHREEQANCYTYYAGLSHPPPPPPHSIQANLLMISGVRV